MEGEATRRGGGGEDGKVNEGKHWSSIKGGRKGGED